MFRFRIFKPLPETNLPVTRSTENAIHPPADASRASPMMLVSVMASSRNPPELMGAVFQSRPVVPKASRIVLS